MKVIQITQERQPFMMPMLDVQTLETQPRPTQAAQLQFLEEQVSEADLAEQDPTHGAPPPLAIRVMLADDHELIRQGLRMVLEQEEDIVVIGEAVNGLNLVHAIEAGARPDVVLIDLQMPQMSGVEATARISQLTPDITIIGLSAMEDESARMAMLQAGARAYIMKSMASEKLVQTIRATVPPASYRRLTEPCRTNKQGEDHQTEGEGQGFEGLTPREQDVLQVLLQGYSNKEIARRLVISERTVHTHLGNIFSKMAVNSRTEAVVVALRDGWLSII